VWTIFATAAEKHTMFSRTFAFSGFSGLSDFSLIDHDAAVDEVDDRGIRPKLDGDESGGSPTDERGIARDSCCSPGVAWFDNPAGNGRSVPGDG
jgi:hypothetical protein